jgi:hypothetical protein
MTPLIIELAAPPLVEADGVEPVQQAFLSRVEEVCGPASTIPFQRPEQPVIRGTHARWAGHYGRPPEPSRRSALRSLSANGGLSVWSILWQFGQTTAKSVLGSCSRGRSPISDIGIR